MLTLLIVLASILGYLAIGIAGTRYTIPRAITREYDKAYKNWRFGSYHFSHTISDEHAKKNALENGNIWRGLTIAFPLITIPLTAFLQVNKLHAKPIEEFASWHKDDLLAKQAKQIKELERELGIKD